LIPSVPSKPPLQFRKLIQIQCHGKVNVPRMPEFTGEMHLVCDGADNDKVCSERSAMVGSARRSAIWAAVSSGITQIDTRV
jgi:hypothetical protein